MTALRERINALGIEAGTVQARLVQIDEMGEGDRLARCGRCGQALVWIEGVCPGPDSLVYRGPARIKEARQPWLDV